MSIRRCLFEITDTTCRTRRVSMTDKHRRLAVCIASAASTSRSRIKLLDIAIRTRAQPRTP